MLPGKRVLVSGSMQTWRSGNHAEQEFIKVQSGLHDSVDRYDVTPTYLPISNRCCQLCLSGFVSSLSGLVILLNSFLSLAGSSPSKVITL